jgi:hypothetical protein
VLIGLDERWNESITEDAEKIVDRLPDLPERSSITGRAIYLKPIN